MQTFELRTLGEFALSYGGEPLPVPPTKKARALLAYLVMHRSADVSREALLERFWPDFEPERARDNLKVSLWSVRRTLRAASVEPGEVVRADRTLVRWVGPVHFDVDRFSALCASRTENGAATEALSIYRGEFLEGDFDEWASAQRERLAAQYEALLSRTVAASKDVAASETLIGRNPYDETAYATLIEAELGAGRPQAAALLAERCRSALAEMGAEPSEDFERRFGALRRLESTSREFRLPFVARDAELGELGRRLSEAANGSGSVTVVHGDAGIGKSSLLLQAERMASQLGLRTVELRCKGHETQMLGEWRALYEATTGRSFAETVAIAGSGAATTVARELAAEIATSSAVFFIDDAQHLSGESFSALVELARSAGEAKAVVIASRPEGVARLRTGFHEWRDFSEVRLECLSDADLTSALRQASGNDLPELAHAVFARTKGHPLYIVETLAALIESGTFMRAERGWTLRSGLDESLPVSASMRTFIEGRLTARGSVPATVASALALEPAASASELGSALAMDETTLLDALDDLLSLGLIVPGEAGTQFAFSHDLVQEAATAMLNAGRRVRLHAAFARDLQTSDERNAAIRRARHLLAAGQPLAASVDFLRAARGAQLARLPQDALRRAKQGIEALELVGDSPERVAQLAALHREVARASYALLEFDDALEAVETSATLARTRGDMRELADASLLRAHISAAVRTPAERVPLAREALETARQANDGGLASRAAVEVAAAARESGERADAIRFATEAFDSASAAENWETAQRAGAELILTCATWWDFSEALRWVSRADEAASRAGSAAQAAHRSACALLWFLLERDDEAENELTLARRLNDAMRKSAIETESDSIVASDTFVRFLSAALARVRVDGVAVLHALDARAGSPELPARARALAMMRVDGLLLRGEDADVERAREICELLPAHEATQSAFGLSACLELTRACVAARSAAPDASRALRRALDVVEDHAHRTPLFADAAFAWLALAASEIGSTAIAVRASERADYFRSERRAAAGSAWGGRATSRADRYGSRDN